jgi:predicted CXXCH cytochrome family protein
MKAIGNIGSQSVIVLLLFPLFGFAVEHPGTLHRDDNCSSCHLAKSTGKSVHSAMTIPCTVCHVAQTQGDMTTLTLLMPKDRICSACHDSATAVKLHSIKVKGFCLDCHDAHSSNRRMLLREEAELRPRLSKGVISSAGKK